MKFIVPIFAFFIYGCSTDTKRKADFNSQSKTIQRFFKIPIVIQKVNADTIPLTLADNIHYIFADLIGQYKFTDTIIFSEFEQKRDIKIDDSLWKINKLPYLDTLTSDGLQVIPDYKTSIGYKGYFGKRTLHYPVYLINETDKPKVFFGKSNYGYAIHEAIDTADFSFWHAIESSGIDACGNCKFRLTIMPGEFLVFLMPKYSGELQTSLRIRFKIGENIFISKPFTGRINPNQFNAKKDDDWIKIQMDNTNGAAAKYLFYGGLPRGYLDLKDF